MRRIVIFASILILFSTPAPAQKIGKKAPDFSGDTADGTTVRLSENLGKVVLIDFWASWCGPCKQEMPFLVNLHDGHQGGNFTIIGVNIDKDLKNLTKFLAGLERQPAFPIIHDPQAVICPYYGLEGMPTTVLIDKKGIIRFRHVGFKAGTGNDLLREVDRLIKENGQK
jgi:thiol-disulfide isomerase/thioredoxin